MVMTPINLLLYSEKRGQSDNNVPHVVWVTLMYYVSSKGMPFLQPKYKWILGVASYPKLCYTVHYNLIPRMMDLRIRY